MKQNGSQNGSKLQSAKYLKNPKKNFFEEKRESPFITCSISYTVESLLKSRLSAKDPYSVQIAKNMVIQKLIVPFALYV